MFRPVLMCLILLSLASRVDAAVSISEVAWMGGVSSANHEWIELYNDGPTTDLSGWVLSDGLNLSIALTGTIPGQSYGVLERTSEASAPSAALLIYTGALVNTGSTLTLKDQNGNTVDRVVGGENWELIGGDNTTKDTAQYTSSGWVTDTPTPGAVNNRGRTEEGEEPAPPSPPPPSPPQTANTSATRGSTQVTKGTSRAEIPRSAITLSTTIPEVAFVGQVTHFDVTAAWVQPKHQRLVEFVWNFGDGTATSGRTVEHRYEYPGTYVVSVTASHDTHEQVARGTITVLPTELSITVTNDAIHIHNDAVYEIDVSGYVLKGEQAFRFPAESIMAPRGTITLNREVAGKVPTSAIALHDRRAAPIAYASDVDRAQIDTVAVLAQEEAAAAADTLIPTPFMPSFSFADEAVATPAVLSAATSATNVAAVPAPNNTTSAEPQAAPLWPYVALLCVIACGVVALWPRPSVGTALITPPQFPFS